MIWNTAKLFEYRIIGKILRNGLGDLLHNLAGRPLVLSTLKDIDQTQDNLTFLKENDNLWGLDELIEVKILCAAINEATERFKEQEITHHNLTREETQ